MARFGFVGGSYQSQAYSADAQICMNLVPEKVESGAGKSEVILIGSPGLALFGTLPDTPNRSNGLWQAQLPNSVLRAFAVAGNTLFEVLSDGTSINRGNVLNDGLPVSLASSSIQLMIASGGQGYCLNFATNVLTGPIATITGVTQVGYIDGFFWAAIGGTASIFISTALDGTTWDPAQKAIVSVFPDNIISAAYTQRQLCLLGEKQSVCYYDSGNVFPFDVVPGGFSEQGSAATFGVTKADNTLFGIWADERGGGVAFRAQGYTLQRISTHAVENAWLGYSKISDAVAYSIQIQGHTFVIWYFPTANKTWVFDVATGLWAEWGFWAGSGYIAHRSCSHMFAFGKHLVGDWNSGNIYQMSFPVSDGAGGWLFCDDFGNPKRWLRRSPYVGMAGVYNYFNSIEFLMDVGLGPSIPLTDGSGVARDPQAIMRWSDDGGHNWPNERTLSLGKIGKFDTRVMDTQLGSVWGSIGRIWELSGSDAIPVRITDADLDADPQMKPQKRLAQELRERA
jgi:hypothetical protein